MAKHKKPARQF